MGWIIYDKSGAEKLTIKELQYNGEFMGERYISFTLKSEVPVNFAIGDYLTYRNEVFTLNYIPSMTQKARYRAVGDTITYENVKFNSVADELTRCDFLDYVLEDNKIHFSALPTFSFYAETVQALADRIQANLNRLYYTEEDGERVPMWTISVGDITGGENGVLVDVNNIDVWTALGYVNSQFKLNFYISGRTITIGVVGKTTGFFAFGRDNGLTQVSKTANTDQKIITRLRAYGSTRNMPMYYYNNRPMGVVAAVNYSDYTTTGYTYFSLNVDMTKDTCKENVTIYFASQPNKAFKGKYVYRQNANNTNGWWNIRLQGRPYDIFGDNSTLQDNISKIEGANWAYFPADKLPLISAQQIVRNLMLPGFCLPMGDFEATNDAYIDSENISELGVREGTIFFDGSGEEIEIYPTIEGMTANELVDAGYNVTVPDGDNGLLDEVLSALEETDDGRWADLAEGAEIPQFYVAIKNIGFDLNDYWYSGTTPKLSMKSGLCGGREFEIAKCQATTDDNGVTTYILTCNRAEDTEMSLYFPNNSSYIQAGDKFVLIDIELPKVYIDAASIRLYNVTKEYLSKNDYVRFTHSNKVDNIILARQHDFAKEYGEVSIYETIQEGDILSFEDTSSKTQNIPIDKLVIKEGGVIPTYEITTKEEKEVGSLQKIQNKLDAISVKQYTTAQGAQTATANIIVDSYANFPSVGYTGVMYFDRSNGYLPYIWNGYSYVRPSVTATPLTIGEGRETNGKYSYDGNTAVGISASELLNAAFREGITSKDKAFYGLYLKDLHQDYSASQPCQLINFGTGSRGWNLIYQSTANYANSSELVLRSQHKTAYVENWDDDNNPEILRITDTTTSTEEAKMFLYVPVTSTKSLTAESFYDSSDERLKENILPVRGAHKKVASVKRLHLKEYDYKKSGKHAYGYIAQDVKEIYPELVSVDNNGFLSLDYNSIILLQIKNLEAQIAIKDTQIAELEKRLSNLEKKVR